MWIYEYNNIVIVVRNGSIVELLVDGEVQDSLNRVWLNADLKGKLSSGEEIKVHLCRFIKVKCDLYVDNILQTPVYMEWGYRR